MNTAQCAAPNDNAKYIMKFDNSWEALTKPGSDDHYFQFEKQPEFILSSGKFEISNACLLAELCRLIYRIDQVMYCNHQKISFLDALLDAADIQWLDCFKNEKTASYAWLLKKTAYDVEKNTQRDCLILIFRGTNGIDNWKLNANAVQKKHAKTGNVHSGFYDAYLSIEEQLKRNEDLKKLPVILAGHSLGAALSILTISSLSNSLNVEACYTFGSPKIGDLEFCNSVPNKKIYRVINRNDIVTMLPFDFLNNTYKHCGESHYFTADKHHIDQSEKEILNMQQNDLPDIKQVKNINSFLKIIKSFERDIPSYLSDHAPVNYLVRLNSV